MDHLRFRNSYGVFLVFVFEDPIRQLDKHMRRLKNVKRMFKLLLNSNLENEIISFLWN